MQYFSSRSKGRQQTWEVQISSVQPDDASLDKAGIECIGDCRRVPFALVIPQEQSQCHLPCDRPTHLEACDHSLRSWTHWTGLSCEQVARLISVHK